MYVGVVMYCIFCLQDVVRQGGKARSETRLCFGGEIKSNLSKERLPLWGVLE